VRTTSRAGYEAFKRLEPESLATWLRRQGYLTGFVGKYFNTYDRSDTVPPGWDEFYGRLYGADRGNGTTQFALREFRRQGETTVQNEVVAYPNGQFPDAYSTRVFGAKAEAFVRRAAGPAQNPAGRPFALFLWTVGVNTDLPEPSYASAALPPWDRPPSFLEEDMSDKPR
jgi:arylsulfatase A-like enzyme